MYDGQRGVWLSDRVMTGEDFPGFLAGAGDVLTVEIPEEVVAAFEWPDDDGVDYDWRGFLVPAEIVNRYPRTAAT